MSCPKETVTMSYDLSEQRLGSILETAQPVADLPPATRARVLAALANSPGARGGARRGHWRLATGLAFAAVALFALGFVPFPMGSAKGALTKAMAALEQLRTRHSVEQSWDENGNEYLTETWMSSDGFLRQDACENGKLSHVWLIRGTSMLYFYVPEDGQLLATEQFLPAAADRQQHRVEATSSGPFGDMVGDTLNMLKEVDAYKYEAINEYQERTLWGGAVDIVEVETDHGAPRHGQKWRFETDPTTGQVMEATFYVSSGTAEVWTRQSQTRYEWDAPVPERAREFTLPAGTKLTRHSWWQDKFDKVVAQASTPDGEVTLHDVQVDSKGNIVASTSARNVAVRHQIVVEDNVGNTYYGGSPSGVSAEPGLAYEITPITKVAGDSTEVPTTATFTFQPYQEQASEGQVVVLKDVPLPARQPLSMEDLMRKDNEVVQY
jgi:hypothetical protein